jgi:antitoxin (DNA-binding transcriptional repressor) of toxin-antitoxin stability system
MATISIEEAQTKLVELIHSLTPGEEVVITENDRPVATLALPRQTRQPDVAGMARKPRELGKMKGTVLSMEHFDDPLEEFKEYK